MGNPVYHRGFTCSARNRPSIDLSGYHSLTFDIRALDTSHCIRLDIKDCTQPDDGTEITAATCLPKPRGAQVQTQFYPGGLATTPKCIDQWSTITLPLNACNSK